MELSNLQPIGYQALIKLYGLEVTRYYRASYVSHVGQKRLYLQDVQEIHIYPKDYLRAEPDEPFANLEFALKHEGINLALIKLVFERLSA